jgi:hypothetical protein
MTASPPPAPTSGFDRLGVFAGVASGLVGLLVSIACVAVPLLHFVLGPLGPSIGGFVAGRVGLRRMALGAFTMAVGVAAIAAAFTGMLFCEEFSGWKRIAPAIVFVYTGALAAVGAFFGAATAPRE